MTQYIDKAALVAEIERRKNQFVFQAESFHKIGKEDKESYYAALASNMNSLSCFLDSLEEESVSNDLEEESKKYSSCIYLEEVLSDGDKEVLKERLINTFKAGAQWQKENLWKPADGDDLPEIDKEVIVLRGIKNPVTTDSVWGCEVAFAHRPNPKGWDGKSITTGKVEHYDVQTYGKGGWNIPDVKFWLDCKLPKMEE